MDKSTWFNLCFEMMLDYIPENFTVSETTEKFRSVITHIEAISEYLYAAKTNLDDNVAKYFSLAGVGHKEISNYDTALKYYLMSVSIRTQNNNEKALALVYNNIAVVYNIMAEREKAIEYYNKSIDISRKYNEPPMNLAISYNNLANVYLCSYAYNEAFEWNESALALIENHSLTDNPLCVDIYLTKSTIHYVNENFEEALKIDFAALDLLRKHFQEEHSDIGTVYNCIAREYFSLKQYPIALEYYFKAHRIFGKVYGDDDSDTAEVCGSIARTYTLMEEYELALEWYSKALEAQRHSLGDNHPEVMLRHSFMSDIYEKMELYSEAIKHLQVAFNFFVRKKYFVPLYDLCNRIADNYEHICNYSESAKFREMATESKNTAPALKEIEFNGNQL